jgi:hypothetical protein
LGLPRQAWFSDNPAAPDCSYKRGFDGICSEDPMFSFFQPNRNSHLRRVMTLLEEANLARIEHQAAAEHHGALARMYAERAKRLEREVYGSTHLPVAEGHGHGSKNQDDKAVLYALDANNRRLEAQLKS